MILERLRFGKAIGEELLKLKSPDPNQLVQNLRKRGFSNKVLQDRLLLEVVVKIDANIAHFEKESGTFFASFFQIPVVPAIQEWESFKKKCIKELPAILAKLSLVK
ncbi:hypothetical protein HZC30_01055 [Candidatus Woesearchaeota archaeon]|nr:hypothetical protein [Candidatus Woesearchaeota archaeon]